MTYRFKKYDIEVHDSWEPLFNDNLMELKKIEQSIGTNFTPNGYDVFKIFKLAVNEIKFVIIGQDPYPQRGVATGRSFEVINESWSYVNKSLESILVSLHYHMTAELIGYCDILQKIKSNEWSLIPPDRIFAELESQSGCFFLNKSLTCPIGGKNKHEQIWNGFTSNLILYIASKTDCKWLLWGAFAHKLELFIPDKEGVIKADHPAKFSYSVGDESEKTLFEFAENSGLNEILYTTKPKLH